MLNLEINENESRLDFTKKERIDYTRQLEEIERMKAESRRVSKLKQNSTDTQNFGERELGESDALVASKLGIGSGRQ